MRSVDERVVEMRFDNKDFENGIRESMSTLNRFESSLDGLGSTRSIDGINKSVSRIDFSPLSRGIEEASKKFTMLETIATGVLLSIGAKFGNIVTDLMGHLTAADLSIKQITAGWDKYADKTSSVQTIMAATAKDFEDTGEQMEYVNEQLDKLNWFTDETSYNFVDMTNNIGKFTSNGIKLDKSVEAMQGIANWAAISGANAGEASRAMYNLSQALATGSVKLIDWKSIENANMATAEFKEMAIQAAEALGTLKKTGEDTWSTLDGKEKVTVTNFNAGLSKGWFTSDVLMKTLSKYGEFTSVLNDAMDEMGDAYDTTSQLLKAIDEYAEGELDIADIVKETGLSTEVVTKWFDKLSDSTYDLGRRSFKAAQEAKTFQEAIDATKDAVSTGWMNVFQKIFGDYQEAKELWTDLANELWEVFAAPISDLNDTLDEWRLAGGREDLFGGIADTWESIKVVIETVKDVFDEIFESGKQFYVLTEAIEKNGRFTTGLSKSANVFYSISKAIKDVGDRFKQFVSVEKNLEKIRRVASGVFSVLNMGKKIISGVFSVIKKGLSGFNTGGLLDALAEVGDFLTDLDSKFDISGITDKLGELAYSITSGLSKIVSGDTFKGIVSELKNFIKYFFDFEEEIKEWGTDIGGIFAMIFNHLILDPIDTASRIIARLLGKEGDDIWKFAEKITKPFQTIRDTIYNVIEKFRGIKVSMPDLSPVTDFIDRTKEKLHPLETVWEWLKKFAEGVSEILAPIVDILVKVAKRVGGAIDGIINGFLDMLSEGDFDEIIKLVQGGSLALISANLVQFSASMNDVAEGAAAGGNFLTNFFNALKDPKQLMMDATESINGFVQALNPLQKEGSGSGIKEIADTVFTLVKSLFVLALIDTNKLDDAILAITGLFAELVGSMKLMSGLEVTIRGVRSLAIAVGVMGLVAYELARLPREDAIAGVSLVAGLMMSLVIPFKMFSKLDTKGVTLKMIAASAALAILANSMQPLGNALMQLSTVEPLKVVTSLLMLAGAMLVLVEAVKMLGKAEVSNMLAVSISLSILAVAMRPFSDALAILATINIERMFTSLLLLAGGMLILVEVIQTLQDVKVGKMLGAVFALTILSTAMVTMAVAFKIVSTISWQGLAVSLIAFAGAMGSFMILVDLIDSSAGRMVGASIAMGILAGALVGMAVAFSLISGIGFDGMIIGIVSFVSVMAVFMGLADLMESSAGRMAGIAASLVILSVAMTGMAVAFYAISKIGWDGMLKALISFGGAMAIFMALVDLMDSSAGRMAGVAAALLILSVAMTQMAIAFMLFKFVDVGAIIKALLTLVGTLAVLGVAAGLMQGLVGTIAGLGAAMILVGTGLTLIGVGITSIALGIASIGALTDAAIIEAMGYIELLIVGTLNIIAHSAEAFAEAFVAVLISAAKLMLEFFASPELIEMMLAALDTIVRALVRYAPTIIEGALVVLDELAKALSEHVPIIVGYLIDLVINIINTVAEKIPIFVDAVVNLIKTFINAVINALNGLDMENLKNGIVAYGMMSLFMGGLAGAATLAPLAMVGVLAVGAVITEMSAVLAALGALYKIPGLAKFAEDGGELLRIVGEGIGKFVGGIIGGVAEGVMSALPQMGTYLSQFMANVQPFIDGAAGIDPAAMEGVASLVKVMMLLTAAELLDQLVGWVAGDSGSALSDFGEELIEFAPKLKQFSDLVKDVNAEQVQGAADATLTLAEMASKIPNSGGLLGMITGENSLKEFGSELVMYAPNLIRFARFINEANTDISREAVQGAADATIALAEMASQIPNSGGLLALITGENSLAAFGSELALYGPKLVEFAESVSGITAKQLEGAIDASLALVDMASQIPNTGGLLALVTGDNSLAGFGNEMANFGVYLSYFSENVKDVNTDQVKKAAEATKELVDMANLIPNSGGLLASVTGDNSLAGFGKELVPYGKNLAEFSNKVQSINVDMVTGAVDATGKLIDMATGVTNGSGGIASIISGGNSLSDFGKELKAYAPSLTDFAGQVSGKVDKDSVQGAVDATIALGDMTEHLPKQDGWVSKILGVNSVQNFGEELASYGENLAIFAGDVNGKVTKDMVQGAADATVVLAQMAKDIPNTGGLVAKITGDNSLAGFGAELAPYGESLKIFADNVQGLSKDDVTGAAAASTELIRMAEQVPNEGGLVAKITGDNSLAAFGEELKDYGSSLRKFADRVEGVTLERVQGAVDATIAVIGIGDKIPADGMSKLIGISTFGEEINDFGRPFAKFADKVASIPTGFANICSEIANAVGILVNGLPMVDKKFDLEILGDQLKSFGRDFGKFYDKIADVDAGRFTGIVTGLKMLANISKDISSINGKGLVQLAKGIGDISTEGISGFVNSFSNSANDVRDSAAGMIGGAISGINSESGTLFHTIEVLGAHIVNQFATSLSAHLFHNIGAGMVMRGLANGIILGLTEVQKNIGTACTTIWGLFNNNLSYRNFYNIGLNIPKGLNDGMLAGLPQLQGTASKMGSIVSEAIRNRLKIQSPSKDTYEVGEYTILGAINGMEAYADQLKTTTEGIVDEDMLAPMKEAIRSINDDGTVNTENQPVIRPVLDLTEIQNGYKELNSLFDDQYRVDMQARMGKMETASSINPEQIDKLEDAIRSISNDDVISEMETLRGDISNLQDAISHMQIVMNTGTLVGEILEPIDAALGAKALVNSRGRY